MTTLAVYPESGAETALETTRDHARIAQLLAGIDVAFERRAAQADLPADADAETVLEAYKDFVAELERKGGFSSVDVLRLKPGHPERKALRSKFLSEHTHDDDEVRYFVEGGATFFLRGKGQVFSLYCERGDLINVPAGAKHWFDTGERPDFTILRFFITPEGWQAKYTGDSIAEKFLPVASA
jgi:1,2-dihydroxy-3-keto-5-methylthiopentene dioxygenase